MLRICQSVKDWKGLAGHKLPACRAEGLQLAGLNP